MTTPARQEIKVLEDMKGVSEFCISAVGEPPFIDNKAGYWIMPLWPGVRWLALSSLVYCQLPNSFDDLSFTKYPKP